ncbi:MAG TPA: hypothetical protein PLC99_20100 [Verrucomicrobiota bacterium]|nr:hypothetical protein [Verrucomicrobiota bacterium]
MSAKAENPFSSSAPLSFEDLGAKQQYLESLVDVDDPSRNLITRFNYSGSLRQAFSEGGLFSLSSISCADGNAADRSACVLLSLKTILGIEAPNSEIAFVRARVLHSGNVEMLFQQMFNGKPVYGAKLVLQLSPELERLIYITSRFVSNLNDGGSEESFSNPESLDLETAFYLEKNVEVSDVLEFSEVYYVDMPSKSTTAIPAYHVTIRDATGRRHEAFLDATTGGFLLYREIIDQYALEEVHSNTVGLNHTSTSCGTCGRGYFCEDGKCIAMCMLDSACQSAFSANWECVSAGDWEDFCADPWASGGTEVQQIYTTSGGWVDTDYQYYHLFSMAKDILDDLNVFLYDVLGIYSWNNDSGSPAPLKIKYLLDHDDLVLAAGSFDGDAMLIYSGFPTAIDPTDYQTWAGNYRLYGHEFGHAVYGYSGSSYGSDECGSEIHAQMHGALFAASNYSQTWGTYNQSAFLDEVWGLTSGSVTTQYLPYALRSTFDNAKCIDSQTNYSDWTGTLCPNQNECNPWEYCNWNTTPDPDRYECNTLGNYNKNLNIWTRFMRIWAEGSATFYENGTGTLCPLGTECSADEVCINIGGTMKCNLGESMGAVWSGAGLANAAGIYSDVVQSGVVGTSDYLQDLALELVANSGAYETATKYALGAIGMPFGVYSPASGEATDRPPSGVLYGDWTLSSATKYIYSWKVSGSGGIKVKYHNGTNYVTLNWSDANSKTAPVMVIYKSGLHIFWADATNSSVSFAVITSNGTKYPLLGYYTLQGLNIEPDGEFDAVVYNNYIYLVYVRDSDTTVYVSRCTDASYCTSSSAKWTSYSGNYRNALDIDGLPGVAAVSGEDLNGLPTGEDDDEYLYVVYSSPAQGDDNKRIMVSRVDTSEDVLGTISIHESAPSYKTDKKIDAMMRLSAYPTGNSYIYLLWRDNSAEQLYMTILQRWDGDDGEEDYSNYWFTRPRLMRIETSDGATFRGDEDEEYDIFTEILYRDGTTLQRSPWVGRY